MKTFVTKYKLDSFTPGMHGLTYKTDQLKNSTKLKEITICFRVNIEYFVILGDYAMLLEMKDGRGWENGTKLKKDQERRLELRIRDPLVNGNLLRIQTFIDDVYKMRLQGNRNWHWPKFKNPVNIDDWNHFCIGYSTMNKRSIFMHNGVVEVDHTRPEVVRDLEDFLPSDWLGPMIDTSSTNYQARKGTLVMKKEDNSHIHH